MDSLPRRIAALLPLLAALTLLCTPALRAQTYTLQDLGRPPAADPHGYSSANAINDQGVICGSTGPNDGTANLSGFTWQNGTFTALPTINTDPDYDFRIGPASINSSGQCVGTGSDLINGSVPFLYKNGTVTDIASYFSSGWIGGVYAINNAGILAGQDGTGQACTVTNGVETALPFLPVKGLDSAAALNNQTPPQVAGNSFSNNNNHAVLWKNGLAISLGTLGGPGSQATAINDNGQVVGFADTTPDANGVSQSHAFLWTPGGTDGVAGNPQMKDLGLFIDGTYSQAHGINNAGQIVGTADYQSHDYAFLWDAVNGMRGLNNLAPTATYSFTPITSASISTASAINNQGQIVGTLVIYAPNYGYVIDHGCLLNPVAAQPAPGVPQNLQAVAGPAANARRGSLQPHATTGTINLSWTLADTAAANILIERQTGTAAFTQIASVTGDEAAYSDTGLAPGTTYTYRVRAANAAGDSAYSNTASAATSPATTGTTHVAWNNVSGALSLWNYSPTAGTYTQNSYGPFARWSAKAIADGGTDGKTRVLWTNTSGQASIWSLNNTTGLYTYHNFGPYAGWSAKALSVTASGTTHVLWANTSGALSLWNYDTTSGTFTQNSYGPYPGWSAKAIADGGTDGKTRVLWTSTNGTASIWSLNTATGAYTQFSFGPYAGWTAGLLSVGSDGTTHLGWNNVSGSLSLWNYSTTTGTFTQNSYGPYAGWKAVSIADGSDGALRVVWDNTSGQASIWSLNNTTAASTYHNFGAYAGWTATAVSAGP